LDQLLKLKITLQTALNLYVKITGVFGIFFAAWWTIMTLGNSSNSIINVFEYTIWLFLDFFPFPFYSQAVILSLILYVFFLREIIVYKNLRENHIILKTSKNLNTKKRLFLNINYIWKCICELFLVIMSLFVTVHLIFVILLFILS
jgi:hypothetical protein